MILLQIPTDVPNPANNTPVNLQSIFEVILYIVAPIVLIIIYFYLRRRARNSKENRNEQD